jgi:hypothetical protein
LLLRFCLGLGLASSFPIFLQPILNSRNAQFVLLAKLSLRLLALSLRLYLRENILLVVFLIFFHVPKLMAHVIPCNMGLVGWILLINILLRYKRKKAPAMTRLLSIQNILKVVLSVLCFPLLSL